MLPEGCAMCGQYGTNNFVVEDLPVGPRTFCTEKHFAQYAGLPVKEFGYYGFEAESFESETFEATAYSMIEHQDDNCLEEIADSLRPKYGLEYNEGVLEWGFGYKSGDVTLYIYDGEGRQLDIITYDRKALAKALKEQGHKNPESWGAESFEARGYAPDKPFYATTHENAPTTVMHPIKCGHYKMVMNGTGVWMSPTFYDTIEEMFTDKFDEIMDTQAEGMTDNRQGYLDSETGQELKRKYQAIKTIGDARKFAKKHFDFKIDFAPCFRKERDYDSKALNALPITVAPIYDEESFEAEYFLPDERPYKEPIVVQFGNGQKIHLISFWWREVNKEFFPHMESGFQPSSGSCGVENRHNVLGISEYNNLTFDDVDCKKCMKRVQSGKEMRDRMREKVRLGAESKKMNPVEKAGISGMASGATMEGLETLLAAESFASWSEHTCEHCGSTDIDFGNNWKCHDCGRYAAESFNTESYRGESGERETFDGGWRCGTCDKMFHHHNDAKHGGCSKDQRYFNEGVGDYCGCNKDAEDRAEYCCMGAESFSAGDLGEPEWVSRQRDGAESKCFDCGLVREGSQFCPCSNRAESYSAESEELDETQCDYCGKNKAKSEFPPVKGYWGRIHPDDPDENDKMGYCSQECFVGSLGKCDDCSSPFKIGDNYNRQEDEYETTLTCDDCFKGYPICESCGDKYHPESEHMESCGKCGGNGWIMTDYDSGDRWEPASSDSRPCEECYDGKVCSLEAESYSAEDKSCECGREGSTKFCEWCRYDKCEKCFQEMKDECRHCEGQDKTLDGKWCEYCDGGEKYICHENNIPEFDWAVMEPEHPYDTTKEEMGYAAEQKSISPYLWGLGIVGFLGYKFLNKK
jgi:hypothetical protein